MTTLTNEQSTAVRAIWHPFSPRYLWRLSQYNRYTSGRCSPVALVRLKNDEQIEARILRAPTHPQGTWDVLAYHLKEMPRIAITTDQIRDIQCGRVVAGYEC